MVGSQFHPEFKSRPNRPHPLFNAFLAAAVEHQEAQMEQEPAVHRTPNGAAPARERERAAE
jgi:CTP synthase